MRIFVGEGKDMFRIAVAGFVVLGLATAVGCRREAEKPETTEATARKDSHGPAGHEHANMPKGVSGTSFERELFLTPGGLYTEADIEANGKTVPSAKYTGISWPHDDDLKPGDKVCPVTANKADERCAWVVNSRKYEFCCTPCLDKFVKWAKERPEKIKEPTEYIHK